MSFKSNENVSEYVKLGYTNRKNVFVKCFLFLYTHYNSCFHLLYIIFYLPFEHVEKGISVFGSYVILLLRAVITYWNLSVMTLSKYVKVFIESKKNPNKQSDDK